MRRRNVLAAGGALASGAAAGSPAPAIAQGLLKLKMVTDWPGISKGFQGSADRLARAIHAASAGRIAI